MVAVPSDIAAIAADKATTKMLVTVSADGQPHAIVCGSLGINGDKVIVGEILMKRASANLKANGKAAMSFAAGPKAYELVLKNAKRSDSGPAFDNMKAAMAKANLPCFAVWEFDVAEIWNESAGPDAGKKVA